MPGRAMPYCRSSRRTVQSSGFFGMRKTPKGERARSQILDAAESLFAGSGFHGTSVRDVASALGIPTASLLHHFPRKERLYGAVLQRIATQLQSALERAIAGRGGYADKLRRLVRE